MGTGATRTPGRIVWHELLSDDVERSIEFYTELFGWRVEGLDMGPGGTYRLIRNGEHAVGGIIAIDPDDPAPAHWLAYANVDDVEDAIATARAHGGDVQVPGMDILGRGRFAVIRDPQGARVCTWQGQRHDTPERSGRAPSGTFCWDELATTDPDASQSFYAALFGWSPEPLDPSSPERYAFFRRGENACDAAVARIADDTEDPQPGWIAFVSVEDTDATVSRAEDLGARVYVAATDSPGGRFAVLVDPTGARFAVYQPPAEG